MRGGCGTFEIGSRWGVGGGDGHGLRESELPERAPVQTHVRPFVHSTGLLLVGVLLVGVRGLSGQATSEEAGVRLDFEVTVPEGTPTLYVAGDHPTLGSWSNAVALEGDGEVRTGSFTFPAGTRIQYKFHLGSWDREALGPSGTVMPNFLWQINEEDIVVRHTLANFRADPIQYVRDPAGGGVVGTLRYWEDVESEFLVEPRHVGVWLPPGYADDPDRRYPVLYMSDGQNLFDPRLSSWGLDWGVDEAMVAGVEAGLFEPAIVVAVFNSSRRLEEYSPWHEADLYARFLIEELMPRVNESFRTRTGPEHTFHMGSSMGGLLSWHLVQTRPDVFGACGCVSSHFVISEDVVGSITGGSNPDLDPTPYLIRDIEAGLEPADGVRVFFDYGTEGLDATYGPPHDALGAWLDEAGRAEGRDYLIREYPGADHNEGSWRERLGDQLGWILAGVTPPASPSGG